MATFNLYLQSGTQYEEIPNVISFVGEDASGQFGILAHHARMIACLNYGLARFRCDNNEISYLALPGAVLYFVANKLNISTRHYIRSKNYQEIETAITETLQIEEESVRNIRETLHRLDEAMLKHLWELKRQQ